MSPRQKKPPVTSEKREEWLERQERGQSPPKIAAADGFDPRTVRKHLEIARQEKESKEARGSVLRNALERHYADLCHCAERLGQNRSDMRVSLDAIGANSDEIIPYEPELAVALRQHIPKSAIWRLLNQQTRLTADIAELTKEFEKKIESEISSDSHLTVELTREENGVIPGIITALTAQSRHWVRGWASLNVRDNLKSEPAENGFVNLRYGAYGMGKVRKEHVELVRQAIIDWTAHKKEWEKYRDLEKTIRNLNRVEADLRDEISVIVLRRVVPGRCRYCPL